MSSEFIPGFERRIKLVTGTKSQTINICDQRNLDGEYEHVFRIHNPDQFIKGGFFGNCSDLTEVIVGLRSLAVEEDPSPVEESVSSLNLYDVETSWTYSVLPLIEAAIDHVVDEFLAVPYLHRVEHSLHMAIYKHLTAFPPLAGTMSIRDFKVGIVQKEWPASPLKPTPGQKRGNFDLAILGPGEDTANSCTFQGFRAGLIGTAAVIEVGLNYPLKHLQLDHDKMLNCAVGRGYLIHFCRREVPVCKDVEAFVESSNRKSEDDPSLFRVAYVHHQANGSARVCRLHEEKIQDFPVIYI